MDLTAVFIVGSITYAIYKLFELIIRRRERLILIDKMTSNSECINFKMPEMDVRPSLGKFTALRIGLIMLGLGIGLIVGVVIGEALDYSRYDLQGASVLIFGSIGMLASFLIEYRMSKNDKKQ